MIDQVWLIQLLVRITIRQYLEDYHKIIEEEIIQYHKQEYKISGNNCQNLSLSYYISLKEMALHLTDLPNQKNRDSL